MEYDRARDMERDSERAPGRGEGVGEPGTKPYMRRTSDTSTMEPEGRWVHAGSQVRRTGQGVQSGGTGRPPDAKMPTVGLGHGNANEFRR